mmetsp:Transcript_28547/g.91539  ORF Transcript_28547/g.91539 Transcript_28547/m.91539 type:complete len:186 (-) Transcript_28547:1625-2182(-)
MRDCARSFNSDGYSVCLEGLRTKEGLPIVYSNGVARGTVKQMTRQTVYLQERILNDAPRNNNLKSCVIINCGAKSFRAPDKAMMEGGIKVINEHYPWSAKATTIFVGLPRFIRRGFDVSKRFIPKDMWDSFRFADELSEKHLSKWIARKHIPKAWGGAAEWSLRLYAPRRAVLEGTICGVPKNGL